MYSLRLPFPCLELNDPNMDTIIKDLAMFLELRMSKKYVLLEDLQKKCKYCVMPLRIAFVFNIFKCSFNK